MDLSTVVASTNNASSGFCWTTSETTSPVKASEEKSLNPFWASTLRHINLGFPRAKTSPGEIPPFVC